MQRRKTIALLGMKYFTCGSCVFLEARKLNLVSDGSDGSVLLAKVYRKQHLGQDKFVGSLADTIGRILGRLNDDGMNLLCAI